MAWEDNFLMEWRSEEKWDSGRPVWYSYIQSKFWNDTISEFHEEERHIGDRFKYKWDYVVNL